MRVDNSFERYKAKGDPRYKYSISHLFGYVLDVGCGDGYGAYLMSKNNRIKDIIGIDISEQSIIEARKNVKSDKVAFLVANAENRLFDTSFDCVHCGQTLEHVENDEAVIYEIRRITRKRVVFSVPIGGGLSEQHVREYTEHGFLDLIGKHFLIAAKKIFIDEKKHKRLVIVAEK